MLSAVENFGPINGPSGAVIPEQFLNRTENNQQFQSNYLGLGLLGSTAPVANISNLQYVALNHLQYHITRDNNNTYSTQSVTTSNSRTSSLNQAKNTMSNNEFTRPYSKIQRTNSVVNINSSASPLQQNCLNENIKINHHIQSPPSPYCNDVLGPINLVTTSGSTSRNTTPDRNRWPASSSADTENDNCTNAYQLNYSHLYGNRSNLYGTPVIFSPHQPSSNTDGIRPHASYLHPHPTHSSAAPNDTNAFSTAYLAAIQNVTAGIYNSSLETTQNKLPYKALAPEEPIIQTPKKSLASGTFLNDKVNVSPPDTETNNFFKVPSGKEGLKPRNLTRPSLIYDKNETSKAPIIRTHNSTSNFKKGAFIELSNGDLRKVEDMRTEDFIQCAERSLHLQLTEATVVKISKVPNDAIITFSYDKNRSKANIEVSPDHPFFVYGQGWASYNPDLSLKTFGLKCQRLQVGDICISLTKREPPKTVPPINSDNNRSSPQAMQYIPMHLSSHLSPHHSYNNVTNLPIINNCLAPKLMSGFYQPQQPHLYHDRRESSAQPHIQSLSNGQNYYESSESIQSHSHKTIETIEPVDATLSSRKRRWSAPESIDVVDDVESDCQPSELTPMHKRSKDLKL